MSRGWEEKQRKNPAPILSRLTPPQSRNSPGWGRRGCEHVEEGWGPWALEQSGKERDGIHLDGGGKKEKKVIPVALCSGKVITLFL